MSEFVKTTREGNKITKVCIEDVYKLVNKVIDIFNTCEKEIDKVLSLYDKEYEGYEGQIIVGTGTSEPCKGDKFDERIGDEIAFRKAKLNANIKKVKMFEKAAFVYLKAIECLDEEQFKLEKYIYDDIMAIREYNPKYLSKLFDENGNILW